MNSALSAPHGLSGDPLYTRLKEHVIRATGLAYYEDKDSELAQRIGSRLSSLDLSDCNAYLNLLCDPLRGPAELDALIAQITIGETYFFRHREHFDALRDLIIPDLIARNREHRSLQIWSAGCADGPETYSLAILLKREMAAQFAGWKVTILGTDINRVCLARAREGRFEEWALRAVTDDIRRNCFRREGRRWSILPQYREGVSFRYHNLAEHPFPSLVNNLSTLDLIVCRNVMIYFGADRMRKMILQFYDSLAPGGWLLVGPTEPNMTFFRSFRTVNAPGVTLYQKPVQSASEPILCSTWNGSESFPAADLPAPPAVLPANFPSRMNVVPAPAHGLAEVRRHADRGAWDTAALCCEELLKKDKWNSQVHFYYGLVLDQIQKSAEAERALRQAIRLDQQSVLPHYYLGLFLQSRGDLRRAARSFADVVHLLSTRPDADIFADADGITAVELRNLVRMHIETLRERG